MTLSGKIIQVLPAESVGQSSKTKQTFVLETSGQYPKKIAFDVWENKISLAQGEDVEVHINIESREYNSKWYTNVVAWKKEGATSSPAAPSAPASAPAPAPSAPPATGGKLSMNEATFQKAKAAVIAIEGDDAKRVKFNEIKAKYDISFEQASEIERLINDMPF